MTGGTMKYNVELRGHKGSRHVVVRADLVIEGPIFIRLEREKGDGGYEGVAWFQNMDVISIQRSK
jgi:hypothetical protein